MQKINSFLQTFTIKMNRKIKVKKKEITKRTKLKLKTNFFLQKMNIKK